MLSTSFGVGTFLILLTFASHILLNLWVLTTVDAVAHDAATDVAVSGATDETLADVQADVAGRAKQQLGRYGDDVDLTFVDTSINQPVVLEVSAPAIGILPAHLASAIGFDAFERRIVVEREVATP